MRLKLLLAILFTSVVSFGQLVFQNKTTVPIQLAFGYFTETTEFTGWITEGWYVINPGEKLTLIDKPLVNEYFYYYAASMDTVVEFKGDILMKVGDGKFRIQDATSHVSMRSDNHRFFRQIDTEDKKNYIVILHESFVEER